MTVAGAIEPLQVGSWHIHGGWWGVGAVVAFTALGVTVLGLCFDDLQKTEQIGRLETRMKALEGALAVPHDLDLTDDTPTDQIPAQPPPAPGPPTTPKAAAIQTGAEQLVANYWRDHAATKAANRKQ